MRHSITLVLILTVLPVMACASPPSQEPAQPVAQPVVQGPARSADTHVANEPSAQNAEKHAQEQPITVADAGPPLHALSGLSIGGTDDKDVYGGLLGEKSSLELIVSTKGSLDSISTQAVMELALDRFESCTSHVIGQAHPASAPLKLTFRIGPNGNASAISLQNMSKAATTTCMVELVRSLHFPKGKRATDVSVVISYPKATQWGTIGIGTLGSNPSFGQNGQVSRPKPPQIRIGKTTATKGLDKAIIRRYIRRKLGRIRHCYEKVLVVQPNLLGTLTVTFEITVDGTVAKAETTSKTKELNTDVGDCVAKSVRSIQFPPPQGGGIVRVTYPFTFKPAK